MQTFFITWKSLGGHAKTSVTSLLLKIINFHATSKFNRQYWKMWKISYWNKAIIGVHYFDIMVWLQCTHFCTLFWLKMIEDRRIAKFGWVDGWCLTAASAQEGYLAVLWVITSYTNKCLSCTVVKKKDVSCEKVGIYLK